MGRDSLSFSKKVNASLSRKTSKQLACGGFDFKLDRSQIEKEPKLFGALEIDLFQFFSLSSKQATEFKAWVKSEDLRIILRIRLLPLRSIEEYQDALNDWNVNFKSETLYLLIQSGKREWCHERSIDLLTKLPTEFRYFFEWGRNDSFKTVEFLERLKVFQGWVVDPDWHYAAISALADIPLNFKLHGWSQERWVRRYGELLSARIIRKLQKRPESILTLSYSGKWVEAPLFVRRSLSKIKNPR